MNTDDINSLDSSLHIGGTEIQYYILCPRKLWWFAHQIEQEHSSDLVAMGRHLHE
ncbi:MAG: Dna2/Cas4 domain-containing protein, partial [Armatimonadetes bacterium]|nr:Dna2/Cas4 domain-containing protein [Armatimonadota bacterium]